MKKMITLLCCLNIISLYSMKKPHALEVLKDGIHIKISKGVVATIPLISGMLFKAQITNIENIQDQSKKYIVTFNDQPVSITARNINNLKVGDFILFGRLENSTDFVEM